ncbi:hypothetical protein [Dyella mobilis]|nr:hypothetical protein [Dyella mobilis]
MLVARSAISRGMQLVAGMLSVVVSQDTPLRSSKSPAFNLVTWTSNAQSRREDELARFHQSQIEK